VKRATSSWIASAWLLAAVPGHADDAAIGREIFDEHCARCHGKQMQAPAGLAFDLRKFPPGEAARFQQSVLKGTAKGMPAWQGQLSPEDIKALWDYVKSGG
jgi:mono/diheme cytochrome c family protein